MCTPSKNKIQFWHFALLVLKTEFCSEHILRLFGLFSDQEPDGRRGTTVTKPCSRIFLFAAVPFKCLTFKRLIQCKSLSVTAELQTCFTGFSFAVVLCKCHVQGELQILSPHHHQNPHVISSQPCWEWCCFPQVHCLPQLSQAGRPWLSARLRQQLQERHTEPLRGELRACPAPQQGHPQTPWGHFCSMRLFLPCSTNIKPWLSETLSCGEHQLQRKCCCSSLSPPFMQELRSFESCNKTGRPLGIRVTSSWFTREAAEQVSFCFSTEEASKIPCLI